MRSHRLLALLLVGLFALAAIATVANDDLTTTPLRATLLPFLLIDSTVPISASVAVDCDATSCTKDNGLAIELEIEAPCDFPAGVTSLPFTYLFYSGLSQTDGIQGDGKLDRDMTTMDLTAKKRRTFKNTITFPLGSDLPTGEHVSIHIQFSTLLEQLNDKTACFLILEPLELTAKHLTHQAHSSFSTGFTPPGTPDADKGNSFNTKSTLSSVVTKTQDTTGAIYTFTLNGFVDDVASGYITSPLIPEEVNLYLIPTGTLQTTIFDAGYTLKQCSLLNTQIPSKNIKVKTDFGSNLVYFELSLPKTSQDDGTEFPPTPYSQGHIISDQLQFRCDFVLQVPFSANGPSASEADDLAIAPFARQNDWGFTITLQQSVCHSFPLFTFGCTVLLPFQPSSQGRYGKEITHVDLVHDVDITNQIILSRFFKTSTARYYHNIPTTVTTSSINSPLNEEFSPHNDLHDDHNGSAEYEKDDAATKSTVFRSHFTFTTQLPESMLTNTTFFTPGQLQYKINYNTHLNEKFISAAYTVTCLDATELKDPIFTTHLMGSFYGPANADLFSTTTHAAVNHVTYHTSPDTASEVLVRPFPTEPNPSFYCHLIVQITTEDRVTGAFRRVYPFPTLIMSTSQQFKSKSSADLLHPVVSLFEAPLPYYSQFSTPFANILETPIAVDVVAVAETQDNVQDTTASFTQLYSLSFQLTNSDSYRPIKETTIDLMSSDNSHVAQWMFKFTAGSPFTCTVDYDELKDPMKIPTVRVSSLTSITFSGFEIPHGQMASFDCPGLRFGLLSTTPNPFQAPSTPLLAISTLDDKYVGYLLGDDVEEHFLDPKKKQLIKTIITIVVAALVVGFIIICAFCCFCSSTKKPAQPQQEQLLLNEGSGYEAPNQF